jgi:site-specific DNA recombinase
MKIDVNSIYNQSIPKKIAIYARVSSQKQKDEETIESQIDVLKIYAKEKHYNIDEKFIFLDNGVSGSTMQRPALDELRDLIRFETIDIILMYAPDRLSRNYTHQLILMEEFKKYGVKICFLKNPPETSTPEAKMFQHFQGIFAEYERALFLDRSRRGRIYKAKQGDPSVLPSVPYGYRKLKKETSTLVVIVEEEAAVVREIFRLYIHESHSLYDVAKRITESGKKPRKGGSSWETSTIKGILKNPTYLGTSYFGKTERSEGTSDLIRKYQSKVYTKAKYAKKMRPEEEWIPISVPQIISESDFELSQEKMKRNIQLSPRNTKKPCLLQGLITCGMCGQPFYKRGVYYYCRGKIQKKYKKCSNKSLRQDKIDEHVFAEVLYLLQTPDIIEKELTRRAKESSNTEEIAQREIVSKKELTKLSIESDRLLDAYQTGVVELKELKRRNKDIDLRRKCIEKILQGLQALKLEVESGVEFKKLFDNTLKKIQTKGEGLSFDVKRKLIRLLVEQIVVDADAITIVHCVSPRMIAQEECLLRADGV